MMKMDRFILGVMPGLVPGIHVFLCGQDVDGRDEPGHDEGKFILLEKATC